MQSVPIWYDLVVNEPKEYPTKKMVRDSLKSFRAHSDAGVARRFIYFIATRPRIRFAVQKKPRISICKKKVILYVVIGRKLKRRRFGR